MGRPRNLPTDTLNLPHLLPSHPKGRQIRDILSEFARAHGAGQILPSERALADHWGVARQTVRSEIQRLVNDGLLVNRAAYGVFTASVPRRPQVVGMSFTDDMTARGFVPGSVVLEHREVPADGLVAAELDVEVGAPVFRLGRVRTADGVPIGVELSVLPLDRFPGLSDVDFSERSLFAVLRDTWNVELLNVSAVTRAVQPSVSEAASMGVEVSLPCLSIESTLRDETDSVVEFSRGIYRGDLYELDTSRTLLR